MRKSRLFLLLFICLSIFTFGADANPYVEKFKFFTLLPPLIAIILAFITKNIILSLIIGVLSGSMLINSEMLLNLLPIYALELLLQWLILGMQGLFYKFLLLVDLLLLSLRWVGQELLQSL